MFTSIEGFKTTWSHHSGATKKILAVLTDDSLGQSVADDHRTIGRMAWHIVQTIPEMGGHTGLKIEGPGEKEPVPVDSSIIADSYTTAADSLLEQVTKDWNDDSLQTEDSMYGETWKRGLTLRILIDHEVHHRGQLTVLMRQAGLTVPGLYGPSKEEWGKHGMKEPEI
ncbi:MAG: DinB family protein [candidate division Zixibacteria bacterium]